MKQTKTIPFKWELYNNNRDKYTVIHRNSGKKLIKLAKYEGLEGVYEGSDGWDYRHGDGVDPYNLQLQYEEEVVESWVYLYYNNDGSISPSFVYNSEELAKKAAERSQSYIATINLNDLV